MSKGRRNPWAPLREITTRGWDPRPTLDLAAKGLRSPDFRFATEKGQNRSQVGTPAPPPPSPYSPFQGLSTHAAPRADFLRGHQLGHEARVLLPSSSAGFLQVPPLGGSGDRATRGDRAARPVTALCRSPARCSQLLIHVPSLTSPK